MTISVQCALALAGAGDVPPAGSEHCRTAPLGGTSDHGKGTVHPSGTQAAGAGILSCSKQVGASLVEEPPPPAVASLLLAGGVIGGTGTGL